MSSKLFQRNIQNFECEICKTFVKSNGYTDHCPNCLISKHVDINPGDRKSVCLGLMYPISVQYFRSYFIITYKCKKCKIKKRVKQAENDNIDLLFKLIKKF